VRCAIYFNSSMYGLEQETEELWNKFHGSQSTKFPSEVFVRVLSSLEVSRRSGDFAVALYTRSGSLVYVRSLRRRSNVVEIDGTKVCRDSRSGPSCLGLVDPRPSISTGSERIGPKSCRLNS
jgi:hypothetical protein